MTKDHTGMLAQKKGRGRGDSVERGGGDMKTIGSPFYYIP